MCNNDHYVFEQASLIKSFYGIDKCHSYQGVKPWEGAEVSPNDPSVIQDVAPIGLTGLVIICFQGRYVDEDGDPAFFKNGLAEHIVDSLCAPSENGDCFYSLAFDLKKHFEDLDSSVRKQISESEIYLVQADNLVAEENSTSYLSRPHFGQ